MQRFPLFIQAWLSGIGLILLSLLVGLVGFPQKTILLLISLGGVCLSLGCLLRTTPYRLQYVQQVLTAVAIVVFVGAYMLPWAVFPRWFDGRVYPLLVILTLCSLTLAWIVRLRYGSDS